MGLAALTLLVAVAADSACSASGDREPGASSDSSNSANGGGSSDNTNGVGGNFSTSAAGGSQGDGGSCAGSSVKAEKQPLDMYIMLDQSGSMTDSVASSNKWDSVTAALQSFVQQPAAAGIGVGIQYFPLSTDPACPPFCSSNADCGACGPCLGLPPPFPGVCANVDDSCDVTAYATPEVPIAPLPGVESDIITSIASHNPGGNTPTSAALQGAVDYTTTWATANPDHVVIVVLATDGEPTSCDTNLNNINAIAAAGANGTPPILTFVIGVGSDLTTLNGIAAAGGTTEAFLVDTNQDVTQQFLDALNTIQGTALGCIYSIPQPDMGTPDYGKVNVEYTPGDGGPTQTIPKVTGPEDCPTDSYAWHYDDNNNPTQIVLCEFACSELSSDLMGQIDIVLGCASVIK